MSSNHAVSPYRTMLEQWLRSSLPDLYECPDRPELACYGSGDNGWGVQTNQKAFAAFAVLAADPGFDPQAACLTRQELVEVALRTLRFSLQSHIEGDYHCTDGTSWGHTWISALGLERMMHGVDSVAHELTPEDHSLLRKVLISESEWLLDHYPIVGGLYNYEGRNKPESNLWNGALLHRTASLYPDYARADECRERGLAFLINSVSVPSDAANETIKDGKPIAERFVGANFFESMALNHHGYLNVGYMVICLSNMAMLHFYYKKRGMPAPQALYHNMKPLWEVVKLCTFSDGRLLRIGGDTRIRYTYCQDYVIPVWHMIRDVLGDQDCDVFEERWLKLVRLEMAGNGDGSFFSVRTRPLREQSPLYYTRLESDRAVALSMGLAWKPLIDEIQTTCLSELALGAQSASPKVATDRSGQAWHDHYHGAYLHVSAERIASWVWESAEKPQGLCIPAHESSMAEWKENLAPHIAGLGRFTEQRLERHEGYMFEGGFLTWGSTRHHTVGLLAEGQPDHDIARSRIVCAALPDNTHMIVLQHTAALERRTFARGIIGLHLMMPNDLFNGCRRSYAYEGGECVLEGADDSERLIATGSAWLNIDNKLGVIAAYGAQELTIRRPGRRQIGLRDNLKTVGAGGMLYADEICAPCEPELRSIHPKEVLVDAGFIIQANATASATRDSVSGPQRVARSFLQHDDSIRAIAVRGADGHGYMVAVNWGEREQVVGVEGAGGEDLATSETFPSDGLGNLAISIRPGSARIVRMIQADSSGQTYALGCKNI